MKKNIIVSLIISIIIISILVSINYFYPNLAITYTKYVDVGEGVFYMSFPHDNKLGIFGVDTMNVGSLPIGCGDSFEVVDYDINGDLRIDENDIKKTTHHVTGGEYIKLNWITISIEFIIIFIINMLIFNRKRKTKIIDTTENCISYKVFCTKCHKYFISTMTTLDNKTNECCCPYCNTVADNEYNNVRYFINTNL